MLIDLLEKRMSHYKYYVELLMEYFVHRTTIFFDIGCLKLSNIRLRQFTTQKLDINM